MFKKFTENEIIDFFNLKVKKNESYITKYDFLSEELKVLLDNIFSHRLYKWNIRDYSRVRTILDFMEWINLYKITPINLAYTYEDDPELKLITYENKYLINYDNNNGDGDLHNLTIKEKFDFFLFNQTLEHLYNPFLSIKNIYNSLKNNGYVFTSVPTINIPHAMPIHFNGFTPLGLAMLFKTCGFEVLEIGQWGNYEYLTKLFNAHSWPGYSHLSENGIKNEEKNVVSCWILAQKK